MERLIEFESGSPSLHSMIDFHVFKSEMSSTFQCQCFNARVKKFKNNSKLFRKSTTHHFAIVTGEAICEMKLRRLAIRTLVPKEDFVERKQTTSDVATTTVEHN